MGQITLDQSHQVLATLAVNTDWNAVDFASSGLQELIVRNPKEAGRQFTAFLKNGGKVFVNEPNGITINRGRFDPTEFIGYDWSILNDETDQRSIALTELDMTKVEQVTMLKDGEEKLKRLKKDGRIRLDADVFYTFWTNQHLIPEGWKEKVNGTTRYIFFDGTVLQYWGGRRYFLCLYWGDGVWDWSVAWPGDSQRDHYQSLVLAS